VHCPRCHRAAAKQMVKGAANDRSPPHHQTGDRRWPEDRPPEPGPLAQQPAQPLRRRRARFGSVRSFACVSWRDRVGQLAEPDLRRQSAGFTGLDPASQTDSLDDALVNPAGLTWTSRATGTFSIPPVIECPTPTAGASRRSSATQPVGTCQGAAEHSYGAALVPWSRCSTTTTTSPTRPCTRVTLARRPGLVVIYAGRSGRFRYVAVEER